MMRSIKRTITGLILLLVLILFSNQCSNPKVVARSTPNIIFLLADDLRDNTFGAMGHPFVKTPNFDKLIHQGVRFSNAYIAEPVCAPSRVSIFTGMPERLHGVGFTSSYKLNEQQWDKTYPALLRKNGYYTGFIGKFGVEAYTFRGHADEKFDFFYGHDGWTRFFPKDFPDKFSCTPYLDAENDIITPIMGEAIRNFLENAPGTKPFCLSVSFNVPHGSQTTSMYTDYEGWHDMKRPANENPKLKNHPVYDTLYRGIQINIPEETASNPYKYIPKFLLDQDEGRNRTYGYDYNVNTEKEHHIRYYQTITGMDLILGQMITTLNELELSQNTIIIFASDHGILMGEYGMGGKGFLYDLVSKIPCIIYDPGLPDTEKGKTVDRLVSSVDIPATILDYAGINVPREMTGKSLLPLLTGEKTTWREQLFLESLYTGRDNPFSEGIRQGDWKYIRMYKGVNPYDESNIDFEGRLPDYEQLFNLKDDPEEKYNLINKYDNSEMLNTLRNKVNTCSDSLNKQRSEYKKVHEITPRKK